MSQERFGATQGTGREEDGWVVDGETVASASNTPPRGSAGLELRRGVAARYHGEDDVQRARHRKAAVLDLHLLPAAVLRGVVADQAKRVPHAQRLGGADVARRNRRHAHRGEGGPVGRARGEERQHVCSARGATGYAEPPLPRARTRSEQPPARAGRAAGPGPVHAADAGARGTVVRTAAAAALDRRVRAGSGLRGRLRCLRDRAANHNCIMIFGRYGIFITSGGPSTWRSFAPF